ncbi:MAG: hypothetical protein HOW73_16210 [Polyangiaceae bacterium]|nr:hypothetical protein [Polyangiaceae bacterium]
MRLPRNLRCTIGALLIGSIATTTAIAGAQDDKAKAALLAREAEDLLAQGKVAEACDKLNDSQALDPRGSTLLDLALCREKEGRVGTAYALFEQAERAANEEKRTDRAATAKAHKNALFLKLARVTVNVPKEVVVPGLEVRIGPAKDPKGMLVIPQSEWGKGFPADAGQLKVTASAPNKATWETTFDIKAAGRHSVTVAALKDGSGPAPTPTPTNTDKPDDADEPEDKPDTEKDGPTGARTGGTPEPKATKPTKHEGGRVVVEASVLAGGIGSFLYQAPLSDINGTEYIYKGAEESEFLAICGNTTAVPGAGECDATFDIQFGGAFGGELFLGYAINEDVHFGGRFLGGVTYPLGFWVLGGPSISIKAPSAPLWGGVSVVVGTTQVDSVVTGAKGSVPEPNQADNNGDSQIDIPVEKLAGRSGETPFSEGGGSAGAFGGFEVGATGEISIMLTDNPSDDASSGSLMLSFWPTVLWAPQHGVVAIVPVGLGYRFY